MPSPWVQTPLTPEQAKSVAHLVEQGYKVYREDNLRNSRLVVVKPRSRRRSPNPAAGNKNVEERDTN